jgi:hypothetical protein
MKRVLRPQLQRAYFSEPIFSKIPVVQTYIIVGTPRRQVDGIAATSFILTGFTYVDAQIELTGAPGGVGDWTESAGPANANGCQDASSNHTCTQDTSVFLDGTDLDASPLNGPTYTWEWEITDQTFGGFDENTHVQALFVDCQDGNADCDNPTGLISTHTGQVPEPTTITMLSLGLLGIGAAIHRRKRQ